MEIRGLSPICNSLAGGNPAYLNHPVPVMDARRLGHDNIEFLLEICKLTRLNCADVRSTHDKTMLVLDPYPDKFEVFLTPQFILTE